MMHCFVVSVRKAQGWSWDHGEPYSAMTRPKASQVTPTQSSQGRLADVQPCRPRARTCSRFSKPRRSAFRARATQRPHTLLKPGQYASTDAADPAYPLTPVQ